MPLLEEIKSVLTFAAFRPDPDDAEVSWNKRHLGRRSLLLNINRTHTTWGGLNKKGKIQEKGMQDGEFADIASQRAEEWRNLTDGGWCSISLNNRFIISLENGLSRRDNMMQMLRVNPKSVLGAKHDRGKRYALFHHPLTTASILMACDDALVKGTEDLLRANGLRTGRISCGLFAMLEDKLSEIYASNKPEATGSFLLIATCEGSVAALVQQGGQWTDLRCRSGVGTDSLDPMIQIISPLVQKIQSGTPVYYLHDGNDPAFAAEMMHQLQQIGAQDITSEDFLWRVIGEN